MLDYVLTNLVHNDFVDLAIEKRRKYYMVTMETKSKAVPFRKYFLSNIRVGRFSVSRILIRSKRSSFVLYIS